METLWAEKSDQRVRRFSKDGLIAFVFTTYAPTFFCATQSVVFVVSAKDTNICSYEAISLGNLKSLQHVS